MATYMHRYSRLIESYLLAIHNITYKAVRDSLYFFIQRYQYMST